MSQKDTIKNRGRLIYEVVFSTVDTAVGRLHRSTVPRRRSRLLAGARICRWPYSPTGYAVVGFKGARSEAKNKFARQQTSRLFWPNHVREVREAGPLARVSCPVGWRVTAERPCPTPPQTPEAGL